MFPIVDDERFVVPGHEYDHTALLHALAGIVEVAGPTKGMP